MSPSDESLLRWLPGGVGALFVVLGLVFVVVGIRTAQAGRRFAAKAERTTGTCVELLYRSSSSSDGSTSGGWAPRMAFRTLDGRPVEAVSRVWSSPAAVRVGREAPVLYDPDDPRDFRVDNVRGSGGCIPPAFIAMGSLATIVGLAVLGVLGFLSGALR